MRLTDIHDQIKASPFVSLRLHFSDGSWFELRHPEFLTITRSVLALTIPGKRGAKFAERVVLLDPVHLVRMEPINGNGSQRKRRTKTS